MSGSAGQRLFGTDGIRGIAGQFPLDDKTVAIIGRSLVLNLAGLLGRAPRIVIGRDTRESGSQIELALARGAIAAGATVQSAGVITTPGVAYITRATHFDAGVVISASHNPYQDNGIKVFAPSGKKLADEMERRIEADVAAGIDQSVGSDHQRGALDWMHNQVEIEQAYQQSYINYLATDVGRGLNLEGLRLAVDCANGAASAIAPELFARLGAQVEVLSAQPDGRNINEACGSLHQEGLQRAVIERGLDLGIAFDGDADRALFVDVNGSLVDGDATLLILAEYLKKHGLLTGDLVVATVMSNVGLEIALRDRGVELVRAQVGDRYVLEELLARGAKLGGEQSGHIIFPDISLAGDGVITAIELLRAVLDSGLSLDQLAAQMTRYPQLLVNVRVRSKPLLDTLREVKAETERVERDLQGRGRLLVRYSGTENLARVMIEGEDEIKVREQANRLAEAIRKAIGE
ncbi:MAG TPA: phosphoglucosamine mutase [Blastocatellia bacterium]|nr:phosphoglucosamine mutase [Blastocatellia bacterium]